MVQLFYPFYLPQVLASTWDSPLAWEEVGGRNQDKISQRRFSLLCIWIGLPVLCICLPATTIFQWKYRIFGGTCGVLGRIG